MGDVVFMLEFKDDTADETLRAQTIFAMASLNEFEHLKKASKAPSRLTKDLINLKSASSTQGEPGTIVLELEKLQALRDSGSITDEEFSAAKAKLLDL